ncbi:IS3 family transposase [Rhodococcus erythropolis]|uniref:IS3 family transposase n=3 Tax=Nocardiaceae TaxID=85025 RepID=UPI00211A7624|nr:IS3 family transposase [Rhodococcus erythropolis]
MPEKSVRVLCGESTKVERYSLIAAECANFAVHRMTRLLDVSTSGFYKNQGLSVRTGLGERKQRRADLEVKILDIHRESKGVYGSPRITAELHDGGEIITEKTVAKLMRSLGIVGISPRTFKIRTTVVDPFASFPEDLVRRKFDQGRLDAVWTSDITYLTCGANDMYLCAIKDEHSKRVLGWSIADHMRTELVIEALDMAVAARGGDVVGTIMHSDSETVRAGVFGFPDRYRMETRECWCREFPVFLTLTPIDDRVSFLGFVGSWEPPVRRYASPSG